MAATGRTFVIYPDNVTHEFDDERTLVTPMRVSHVETWDLWIDGSRVALTM